MGWLYALLGVYCIALLITAIGMEKDDYCSHGVRKDGGERNGRDETRQMDIHQEAPVVQG